jgi:methylenetetrahydrofolate reductase (NADPH)
MYNAPSVSFEFFPPHSEAATLELWSAVRRLGQLSPEFVSVTYGAGGTTRERTLTTVAKIQGETKLRAAGHLTCIGADRAEINTVAETYWQNGIRHVVALRGDPPMDAGRYSPRLDGYAYAADLVTGLKELHDFRISIAAYPEAHPESADTDADINHLKRKMDAGANDAITQYFFDTDDYLLFRDRITAAGIDMPIIPGILPIHDFPKVARFSVRCGASVPTWLADMFDRLDDDQTTRDIVAASIAIEQCQTLQAHGVETFHFYTMNRPDLCYAVCHILGVRPKRTNLAA